MTSKNIVKRVGKRNEIELWKAMYITLEVVQTWDEGATWDDTYTHKYGQVVGNITLSNGDILDARLFVNGDEYVAIPSPYFDEYSEWMGTKGTDYLTDGEMLTVFEY